MDYILQNGWVIFGFMGQICFTMRFLVQWIVSEKRKQSVIPVAFWYLSLLGGGILLIYACHIKDPVFIAGQAFGAIVYSRNLVLLKKQTGKNHS